MSITRVDDRHATVLIIDSDPFVLAAVGSLMDMQGYKAVLARDEQIATSALQGDQFDIIILSIDELEPGCQFASRMRAEPQTADVPIIFLVPEQSEAWNAELSIHGGIFSMLKPGNPETLVELVEKALWMPHLASNRKAAQLPRTHLPGVRDWVRLD